MEPVFEELELKLETLMNELVDQQQTKVLQVARARLSHLTADDILNPQDFPQLMSDPFFNYEEGLAAGLMAAQIAIRARILRPLKTSKNSTT